MSEQLIAGEKEKPVADNARKFVVAGFDESLLTGENVKTYLLTTNWLKTGENDEVKLARKEFHDGTVELLLIEKVTENGERSAVKRKLSAGEYSELLKGSVAEIVKERFEFTASQNDTELIMKYDVFVGEQNLCMLEVDAADEDGRKNFDSATYLAGLPFEEVTGNRGYEGYRVAGKV